jgi:nucleoside-diphosphate-sugar epimerase
MTRVLVTGATGFVGTRLCASLARAGYRVRGALRTDRPLPPAVAEKVVTGEIGAATDWDAALAQVDLVVHLAARTHVLREVRGAAGLYMETNARGTARLAAAAARHGVGRFILLSSVKVNGEGGSARPYSAHDEPRPMDAYGESKWRAEQAVWEAAAGSGMQAAVVRAPLVYGPGVRANFLRLLRWVDEERLVPLGAVANRRSLVSVWTLCDLLGRMLDHPRAADGTWMVSDGEDVPTADLVRRLAGLMQRRARLVPVPVGLLRLAGGLLGRGNEVRRLCDSLTVDIADTRRSLDWRPVLPMQEALARTVAWYRAANSGAGS